MTRRDGDTAGKMARMDRVDNSCQNSTGNHEKALEFGDYEIKPNVGKHVNTSSSTSGNGSDGRADGSSTSSHRDSPRSVSLPGSRAGSRPGSRPGSRMHSRTNSQESIIDLFDCMTLTYGQLQLNKSNDRQKGIQLVPGKGIQFVSPKPKQFRNQRWTWHDKVRINSAIWRAWHMQYIKGKKPVVCHFTAPVLEKQTMNPDVIQAGRGYTGSIHWNQSQVDNIVRNYNKWRLRSKDVFQALGTSGIGSDDEDDEEHAIDLGMPHPPLSPMFARKLANDDMPLKDFSDTLFISTGKKFNVPHPKKITQHVYNADIIQPGLMQLEPDFDDDFMDTLESYDILLKTPTKADLQGFNFLADFPTSFLNSDSLSAISDAMELSSMSPDRVMQSNPTPPSDIFPVSLHPSVPHVVRNLDFVTQTSTSQQHQQQQQQQHQQQQHQQKQHQQQPQQSVYHHTSSNSSFVTSPQSTYVVTSLQPGLISSSSSAQPLRTRFTPLCEVSASGGAQGGIAHVGIAPVNMAHSGMAQGGMAQGGIAAGGFDPNRVHSPSLMQALTGAYNLTMPQINNQGFQCMGSTGLTPVASIATVPSHSVSVSKSKVEPLSPTSSQPQTCEVNDTLDVLAYQIPMTPSKMIQPLCTVEWHATTEGDNLNWSLVNTTTSNTVVQNSAPIPDSGIPLQMHTFVTSHQKLPFSSGDSLQRRYGQSEDGMDYEPISPATSGTITPPNKQNKRDRAGNFSRSSSSSPRGSFTSLYPDSALHAALSRQSDAKDLGMLCPSSTTERDGALNPVSSASYPSTAASSAASSPGTPHNELCETPLNIEFEFPAQKAKRQKTPGNGSNRDEKESRRRLKHLKSEHKRRFNIQTGLDELQALVPALKHIPEGTKISTATLLNKAHEHILNLKEDLNEMKNNGEKLKEDIETVNDEIGKCQDELPDSGAPVNTKNDRQLQSMLAAYIKEKATSNWRFWIFSLIVRPLFQTYLSAVCDNPSSDFDSTVTEWIDEHCRLRPLRTVVLSALRQVSKRTSVLSDPAKFPDQVKDIVKQESTSIGGNT